MFGNKKVSMAFQIVEAALRILGSFVGIFLGF